MAVTQLTGRQIKDQSVDLTVDVTGVLPPENGGKHQYILLQDVLSSGTSGGTYGTAGTWKARALNTITNDDTGAVSLSSNNFTLPAGTYEVYADAVFTIGGTGTSVIRLYNRTDSTMTIQGDSQYSKNEPNRRCDLRGKFTIAASKSFGIDIIFSQSNSSTTAMGQPMGVTGLSEIYTQVELRKVG